MAIKEPEMLPRSLDEIVGTTGNSEGSPITPLKQLKFHVFVNDNPSLDMLSKSAH